MEKARNYPGIMGDGHEVAVFVADGTVSSCTHPQGRYGGCRQERLWLQPHFRRLAKLQTLGGPARATCCSIARVWGEPEVFPKAVLESSLDGRLAGAVHTGRGGKRRAVCPSHDACCVKYV